MVRSMNLAPRIAVFQISAKRKRARRPSARRALRNAVYFRNLAFFPFRTRAARRSSWLIFSVGGRAFFESFRNFFQGGAAAAARGARVCRTLERPRARVAATWTKKGLEEPAVGAPAL
jgi:hypothetical protein